MTTAQDLRPQCLECGQPLDAVITGATIAVNNPCGCRDAGLDFRHLAPQRSPQPCRWCNGAGTNDHGKTCRNCEGA